LVNWAGRAHDLDGLNLPDYIMAFIAHEDSNSGTQTVTETITGFGDAV
jgi:hypothetical protein